MEDIDDEIEKIKMKKFETKRLKSLGDQSISQKTKKSKQRSGRSNISKKSNFREKEEQQNRLEYLLNKKTTLQNN